jgi:transcriptional regulator GlxA family with amidase domain
MDRRLTTRSATTIQIGTVARSSAVKPEVANAVARRTVVPPHRDGGQAQYVPVIVNRAAVDAPAPG